MLSIDDRIKKLIGDIGLLKEREAALANGAKHWHQFSFH